MSISPSNSESQRRTLARAFVESEGSEPCQNDFFAFVRWIEGILSDMPRVGESRHLSDDPLIFHQSIHPGFAPSTVKAVRPLPERDSGGPVGRMEGYFLGLLGPSGPMPLSLTEYVWSRSQGVPHPDRIAPITNAQISIHRRDTSLEDFFNIFNHRFISFLYRAWASSRKAPDYDRPDEARFPGFTGSFLGIGMDSLRNRLNVADEAITYFSGHFSNPSRHPEGLAAIVSDYFDTPAAITENVGNWLDIPTEDQCILGGSQISLGAGIVIGARIWDRQLRFRVTLGPMPLSTYEKLFPGSSALDSLRDLVRFYTHRELFAEVKLILDHRQYPGCKLGGGSRLGLSSWLHATTPNQDLDDLLLEIQ